MENKPKEVLGPRAVSVTLTDDMIKSISQQLGIKNIDRIPRELVVNAMTISDIVKTMPRGLALPRGIAVVDVVA